MQKRQHIKKLHISITVPFVENSLLKKGVPGVNIPFVIENAMRDGMSKRIIGDGTKEKKFANIVEKNSIR